MREFFHSLKFKILVCIFALILGLMIYAAVSAGATTVPETILTTLTRPFVQLSTAIADWTDETIDKFVNADKYKQENEILRQQLSEMYGQIMDKDATDEENRQLREMLKIAEENNDFQWSPPCSIIARNSNDMFGGFTIGRGTNDGISLYDPVFTNIGLVGMITEVAPTYAKVTTLLSTEIDIGVTTSKDHTVGIVENDIKYSAEGCCLMSYIDAESPIKTGDVVVTSGGIVYPAGLIIGTVKELYDDDNGLSVHAVITPAEDIFKITSVYVITGFEGQGVDTD